MRHFTLLVGLGMSVIAAEACAARPQRPVASAAVANAADTLRRLLAEGHPVDEVNAGGLTPLMWAARYGAIDTMTILLDAGADVQARDTHNVWTPLLHAIHTQRAVAVRLLLERGADANAATPNGITPLLMAADDPDPSTVKALLEYGANPRVEGPGGATPLTQAVSGGAMTDIDRPLLGGCRPATVRALLEHDPTLRVPQTFAGHQALWWARFHGCGEVLNAVDFQAANAIRRVGDVDLEEAVRNARPQDGSSPTPATGDPVRR